MPTAHISAQKDEIAKVVFMPGDPLRAEKFAKEFLKPGYKKVSGVRNIYAYTGHTKHGNHHITFMGHGMGMASVGIYAYELYKFYDVKRIVRLGTAALYNPDYKMFDILVGETVLTTNNYGIGFDIKNKEPLHAKKELIDLVKEKESSVDSTVRYGRIISSDWFYMNEVGQDNNVKQQEIAKEYNADGKEMEAYALEAIARFLGDKEALTIVTLVHNIHTDETTDSTYREKKVNEMADLAIQSLAEVK